MNDWLLKHSMPIIIALVGVVTSFSLNGYRIEILEKKVEALQTDSVASQVLLAEMKKDIEYIRAAVSREN